MLCITAAALTLALPLQTFTLAWTHSIEKIRWEEDYRISGALLHLDEARIRGHGAGMEVPEGAVLKSGVWHYQPTVREIPAVSMMRSALVADYELCWSGTCRPLTAIVGSPEAAPDVMLHPCDAP